jgi:hypothetical protein
MIPVFELYRKFRMKFARIVFIVAGVLGLLAMVPMYRAEGSFRYYGSLGGLVAWQFAFFVIASAPRRFRIMMIPAMMEKFLWVGTLVLMYFRGYLTPAQVLGGTIPHAILGALFIIAFFVTSGGST